VRPTLRFAGVLLLAFIVYFYGSSSEVSWLFLLAFWILALLGVSYLYARWSAGGIRAEVAVRATQPGPSTPLADLPATWVRSGPVLPVFEGDSIEVELQLHAPSARGPARLSGSLAGVEMAAATGLVPASGWSAVREAGPVTRGLLTAAGWKLEMGDHLGLYREVRLTEGREICLALPLFTSLSDKLHVRELETSLAAPRAGAGSEIFGVREYRRGDSLRRIHWRSSARRGELVAREYESPGLHLLGLFLDPRPESPAAADQIARLAASEAWDCLRTGGRVVAWAPGLEATSLREGRSLWSILEWLARYPYCEPGDAEPPAVAEAVLFATGDRPQLADAAHAVRRLGAQARAWTVGGEADLGVPARPAGLGWPL
jgi:uncharacterized protein (DUF58 family)